MAPTSSRVASALAGAWVLTGGAAHGATALAVVNAGFEDTARSVAVFNEFRFGGPRGWSLYDDPPGLAGSDASDPFYVGTLRPQPDPSRPGEFVFFPGGAPEGDRVAVAYNRFGSGGLGEYGLQQTLVGAPLAPFRTYTLRVEVGDIASARAVSGEHFNLGGFPGYRIELLAGDTPIASDDPLLAGVLAEGEFATSTVTFATDASDTRLGLELGIRLVNRNLVDPLASTADLLFDLIGQAYERQSLIVTTNLPFEHWTEVLGSERLTGAALDRLTHRCQILEFTGESHRLKDAQRRRRSKN